MYIKIVKVHSKSTSFIRKEHRWLYQNRNKVIIEYCYNNLNIYDKAINASQQFVEKNCTKNSLIA